METIVNELTKIQSWPNVVLVFAFAIILGYCLKFWQKFPNELIPPMVIFLGGVLMLMLADEKPKDILTMVWRTRNFVIGLIIGFAAWIVHNQALSRIEDMISLKFGTKQEPPQDPAPKP